MEDSVSRFSRVVEEYRRYRPRYPQQLVALLEAECGFTPDHIIADVGSGTGLLAELFLQNGNQVYGVEPNPEMRAAGETHLASFPKFTSVVGTSEATTLPDHSVHMVTAGQAFHWFDKEPTRKEFQRILVPQGWVVLVWNLHKNPGTAFGSAFEKFWQNYLDPRAVFDSNARKRPEYIAEFFGADIFTEKTLDNHQLCDLEAFKGRVLSSSYSPKSDDPRYPILLQELREMFNEYQENGTLRLDYDTRVVYGQLVA